MTERAIVANMSRRLASIGVKPKRVWARLPMPLTFEMDLWIGNAIYHVAPGDNLARRLYFGGRYGFEPHSLRVFQSVVSSRPGLVLDVGAHTGVYTLASIACDSDRPVIAYEPVKATYGALVTNVLASPGSAVQTRQVAVSHSAGTATLLVPKRPMPSSARLAGTPERPTRVDRVHVSVTSLDHELGDVAEISVLKIDVEGAEGDVIKGAAGILARARPIIILEVLPANRLAGGNKFLQGLGYCFGRVEDAGIRPIGGLEADPRGVSRNVICVPKEDAAAYGL